MNPKYTPYHTCPKSQPNPILFVYFLVCLRLFEELQLVYSIETDHVFLLVLLVDYMLCLRRFLDGRSTTVDSPYLDLAYLE